MNTAKITRLKIEGFKSIESSSLSFGQINVLIGVNGVGKSNLLSFLRLMRGLATRDLQGFVNKSGGANALLRFGAKQTAEIPFEVEIDAGGEYRYSGCLSYAPPDTLFISRELMSFDN